MAPVPQSFTEIEGWRESFEAAMERQERIRAYSLFPEIPQRVCGMRIRPLTMRDWAILDEARNAFTAGGDLSIDDALAALWVLRAGWFARRVGNGRFGRYVRRWWKLAALWRCRFDKSAAVLEVRGFFEDAFIGMPGYLDVSKKSRGIPITNMPSSRTEITLCAEIMAAYPSFRYDDLMRLPLAQFWQWLIAARRKDGNEYRVTQLTDVVNREANNKLNEMAQAAEAEAKQEAAK